MPSGQNAWNQILDTKRWRKSGDLGLLRTKLWRAICSLEAGMNDGMVKHDAEKVLRFGHAIGQLAGVYLKVTLDSDFEKRLTALEERRNGQY